MSSASGGQYDPEAGSPAQSEAAARDLQAFDERP